MYHHVNEENETVVVDDDGTSAHRRLPLRYAGRWEKTYILPRGIHSQKLGPGRFSGKSKYSCSVVQILGFAGVG